MAGVLFLLPGTTVDDVAAAVVRHLIPAAPLAGSVGEKLARVDAAVTSRATPTDVTASVDAAVPPAVRAEIATVHTKLDARLDTTVSSRATKADVNVQVYSEPVPEGKVH